MKTPANKKDILEKYSKFVSKGRPEKLDDYGLKIVLAKRDGVKVRDSEGNVYFDCFCSGGQNVLGNYRTEVRDAFRKALKEYDLGNFILMSAQKAALAKLLAEITPGNLKATVYGVGRGESNDFAMKLARGATGRKEIVCFEGASHGQTGFALSTSDDPRQEKLFGPLIPGIRRIRTEISAVEAAVSNKTAAVIAEPVQSDSGVIPLSQELLKKIRSACDRSGAVFILDEGQTSFGRTGLLFECMRSGITPDILNVAKAMGGTYYPISASIFTAKLNRFMITHPLIHLSTFGGADLGCMVAMATIDIIRKNKLRDNAASRGEQLIKGLREIAGNYPGIFNEVRGVGLLLAMETVNAKTAERFTAALAEKGVIALPAPLNKAIIRFTPPVDITESEINEILEAANEAAKVV